jgi:hypothetical protein
MLLAGRWRWGLGFACSVWPGQADAALALGDVDGSWQGVCRKGP